MMANQKGGAIYTGVTSDLAKRAWQLREELIDGFTKRYRCKRLVWFEFHSTMGAAILREKQIKGGSRKAKITLLEAENCEWRDLFLN